MSASVCNDSYGSRRRSLDQRVRRPDEEEARMPGWRLREFHPDDLDGILRLWEQTHRDGSEPVYALSEVLASCQKDYAVVALRGEEVVGACVGRADHEQGWIVVCATKGGREGRGIGPAMLSALG